MRTFENISKAEFSAELKWHRDQDMILQGSYGDEIEEGQEFKGCMMGCAVNSIKKVKGFGIDHSSQEEQASYLGIPEWFVYLYEAIFEGLEVEDSKQWVIDCFEAIPEGIETQRINDLENEIKIFNIESSMKNHNNKEVKDACDLVIEALKGNGDLSAARSAARSAWSAAESAAWSAESAAFKSLSIEVLRLLGGLK